MNVIPPPPASREATGKTLPPQEREAFGFFRPPVPEVMQTSAQGQGYPFADTPFLTQFLAQFIGKDAPPPLPLQYEELVEEEEPEEGTPAEEPFANDNINRLPARLMSGVASYHEAIARNITVPEGEKVSLPVLV